MAVTSAVRKEKLELLKTMLEDYIERERARLTAERDFLQTVLDESLGGYEAQVQDERIIDTVKNLIGPLE